MLSVLISFFFRTAQTVKETAISGAWPAGGLSKKHFTIHTRAFTHVDTQRSKIAPVKRPILEAF
jgi:hypothetical protein